MQEFDVSFDCISQSEPNCELSEVCRIYFLGSNLFFLWRQLIITLIDAYTGLVYRGGNFYDRIEQ